MRFATKITDGKRQFVRVTRDSVGKFVVLPNTPPSELEVIEPTNGAKTIVAFNKGKGSVMGYNFYLDDTNTYLGQMITDPVPMQNTAPVYAGTALYPGFYPQDETIKE